MDQIPNPIPGSDNPNPSLEICWGVCVRVCVCVCV
jgi:hypothetical protein